MLCSHDHQCDHIDTADIEDFTVTITEMQKISRRAVLGDDRFFFWELYGLLSFGVFERFANGQHKFSWGCWATIASLRLPRISAKCQKSHNVFVFHLGCAQMAVFHQHEEHCIVVPGKHRRLCVSTMHSTQTKGEELQTGPRPRVHTVYRPPKEWGSFLCRSCLACTLLNNS